MDNTHSHSRNVGFGDFEPKKNPYHFLNNNQQTFLKLKTSEEFSYFGNIQNNTVEILRGPLLFLWFKFKDYTLLTKQYYCVISSSKFSVKYLAHQFPIW
jgi:hypothetical protein